VKAERLAILETKLGVMNRDEEALIETAESDGQLIERRACLNKTASTYVIEITL